MDNNSVDKTKEIARRYTDRVFNFGPERSAQRNFGAKKSGGDYLLFLDADMELEPQVVEECVKVVEQNPKIKAVVIPEKSFGEGFWAKCKALERECYLGEETIEAARFFEKKVFFEFGGYDENLTGPEDWDLPQILKKKYKIGRIQSFIRHNEGRLSLLKLARKKYYYAQKLSPYLEKHPPFLTAQQAIYFLRPAFYRNWKKLISHPILTLGMFLMLTIESLAGGMGFLKGKFRR